LPDLQTAGCLQGKGRPGGNDIVIPPRNASFRGISCRRGRAPLRYDSSHLGTIAGCRARLTIPQNSIAAGIRVGAGFSNANAGNTGRRSQKPRLSARNAMTNLAGTFVGERAMKWRSLYT
jgi:hypothetical protein